MKLKVRLICVICCLYSLNISDLAEACSELFIDREGIKIAGRTMDWGDDKFVVVINPRGIAREAGQVTHKDEPVKWVSKYGSVTFNIYVEESPQGATDGMNEHGLSAAALWMTASKYPAEDFRPVLDDGAWVQYCLDNFKTVDEIIADAPGLRVKADKYFGKVVALHLYIHDPSGNSAILEYIEGNLAIYHGFPLSTEALTNDPYAVNLAGLNDYKDFGGKKPLPGGYGHEARFVRAAAYLESLPKAMSRSEAIAYAFNGMSDVAQPLGVSSWTTQWTVVRDLTEKKIQFRNITNANIRTVDLNKIDFTSESQIKILDIAADLSGDITEKFKVCK
ncbi:MAG: linear amide C-N hydrolase [Candidatus Omnitrophota bacterium]